MELVEVLKELVELGYIFNSFVGLLVFIFCVKFMNIFIGYVNIIIVSVFTTIFTILFFPFKRFRK